MIVWLNPLGGLSGDMLLGALIGLGAPVADVRAAVASTGLSGWDVEVSTVRRGALTATRAAVRVEPQPPHRRAADLLEMIGRARPAEVARVAARAVGALARVEAGLHGEPVDEVHLHELGGVDTVVDTVGVAAALAALGVAEVRCGPLPMGAGTVRSRHGVLPLPAPATAALLAEAGAAVTASPVTGETVTPTGAALLLATDAGFGPVPDMTVRSVAYGAGARDTEQPNVVQALLGTRPEPVAAGVVTPMVLLETTVDDVTGEVLGHVLERLLAAGASDAWVTPVTMKKSRPGHVVQALAAPEAARACELVLLRETGSLGLRRRGVERLALPRRTTTVDVDGHPVRVKHGPYGAKPEHDDLAAAAAALGLTLREVSRRALR